MASVLAPSALNLPGVVCPVCKGKLSETSEELNCPACGARYVVVDGIPCFCEGDDFYEGKWVQSDLSTGSFRNFLVKKERFFVRTLRRWRARQGGRGTVLDLGCAGGWRLYTTAGSVVGLDLSLTSLRQARSMYPVAVRSAVTALPFPDESFDLVVSSDMLGHLATADKDLTLKEIRRVLKPGGWTMHYIETDGNDPLMRFARRYPDLYQQRLIDLDGHIGLESPAVTMLRFRELGFTPVKEIATYRGLTYVGRVVDCFDNEYATLSRRVGVLVGFCKLVRRHRLLESVANLLVSGLIEIGDLVLPTDWAGGALVCYEKPELR